ncbi:MAG: cupin domain-containing protein, partial [Pseudomonadota bacterium]
HTGGEEFLVLDGIFSDEHGDFPAGSYIRNPPESSHTPGSKPGCTILVKLWQFDLKDRTHVRIDTNKQAAIADPDRSGVKVQPLYKDEREDVSIEHWQADADIRLDDHKGLEVFVLEGTFEEGGETFSRDSWLRLPVGHALDAKTGKDGVKVWVKRDHLIKTPTAPKV